MKKRNVRETYEEWHVDDLEGDPREVIKDFQTTINEATENGWTDLEFITEKIYNPVLQRENDVLTLNGTRLETEEEFTIRQEKTDLHQQKEEARLRKEYERLKEIFEGE